jgi:hypothetical protein
LLQKVRAENATIKNPKDRVPESIATDPSRATLALHRIIDAPAAELNKKSRDEMGVAQELLNNHQYWKGGNQYLSALTDKLLYATPVIGPMIGSTANRAESGDIAGAATDIAGLVALEHAPAIVKAGADTVGKVGSAVADTAEGAADLAKQKLADAHVAVKKAFIEPKPPTPSAPTPKPVNAHISVDMPFDNAVIRKLGGGELSPEAADVLKQKAGDTVPAGSSPQNHLLKAVAPINDTIKTQGLALNKVLEDAGQLSTAPQARVDAALQTFRESLPGGTEEQFDQAIDKERKRVVDALDSTDPLEINKAKRDLDSRIKDFTKPEKPMNTPADAAEGARVIMRRALSDHLSEEIPQTKPINQELAKNLEARGFLADKLKDVAYDPVEADAQHASELNKGKTIVENAAKDAAAKAQYDAQVAQVKKNLGRLKAGASVASIAAFHNQLAKLLELL